MNNQETVYWESNIQSLVTVMKDLESNVLMGKSAFDVDRMLSLNRAILCLHEAEQIIEDTLLTKEEV